MDLGFQPRDTGFSSVALIRGHVGPPERSRAACWPVRNGCNEINEMWMHTRSKGGRGGPGGQWGPEAVANTEVGAP